MSTLADNPIFAAEAVRRYEGEIATLVHTLARQGERTPSNVSAVAIAKIDADFEINQQLADAVKNQHGAFVLSLLEAHSVGYAGMDASKELTAEKVICYRAFCMRIAIYRKGKAYFQQVVRDEISAYSQREKDNFTG